MSNKHGIEESMDLIVFCDTLVDKLGEAKGDDGKIDSMEIASMVISSMSQAVSAAVGADKIDDELKDLSDKERSDLLAAAMPVMQKMVKLFWKKS